MIAADAARPAPAPAPAVAMAPPDFKDALPGFVTNEWPLVAPAEFKRGQKARYALLEVVSCCEPRPRWERLRR